MSLAKAGATVMAVIAGVIIGGSLLLPSGYTVERSIDIDAPPAVVFDFVNDLAKNEAWSPWKAADPSMVITVGTPSAGKDATYSWTSDSSGAGSLTVIESLGPKHVHTELNFVGMGKARGHWTFKPEGEGTRATWSLSGSIDTPIVGRWFNLMMDGQVGPMFEDGLRRLDAHASKLTKTRREIIQNRAEEAFKKMTPEQMQKTAEAAAALRNKTQ